MTPSPVGIFATSDTCLLTIIQPLYNSGNFAEYRCAYKSPKRKFSFAILTINNGGQGLNYFLVVKNLKIYKK
jgi:hypothetical protein